MNCAYLVLIAGLLVHHTVAVAEASEELSLILVAAASTSDHELILT